MDGMEGGMDASMEIEQHGLDDPTAVQGGVGTVQTDPAQTTLQEVGRAVENMYAVQQQQQLEE